MDLQHKIERFINSSVDSGDERGLQIAAYYKGKLIVSAFGGVADVRTGAPVAEDTLFPVFSTTKGITATAVHILAERGLFDYDTTIASVWPEFAVNGKEHITLRHVLTHTSAIPQLPRDLTAEDVKDWDKMCSIVAGLTPIGEIGVEAMYHAVSYGWLCGEFCSRADGRHFSKILYDEIFKPLGIENDMFIGIPDGFEHRIAFLEDYRDELNNLTMPEITAIPQALWPLHRWMNTKIGQSSCVPGGSGIMTAKALARHYASLLPGGVDGIELLPPGRVKLACESVPESPKWRMGYTFPESRASSFGHLGHGDSVGLADPEQNLAFAAAKNKFGSPDFVKNALKIIRDELGLTS